MKTSHRLIERSLNPSRPAAPTPKEWIPPVQSSLTTDSIGSSAAFNKTPESKGVPFKVSRTRQFTSSGPVNDDLPSRPKRTPEGQLFEVDPTPAYSPFKSPLYYSGNNASSSLDYGALSTFSQTEPSSSPVSQLAKMKINSTTEDAKVEEEELSADVETADLKAMGLAAGGKLGMHFLRFLTYPWSQTNPLYSSRYIQR
jgi:hypothetical protein